MWFRMPDSIVTNKRAFFLPQSPHMLLIPRLLRLDCRQLRPRFSPPSFSHRSAILSTSNGGLQSPLFLDWRADRTTKQHDGVLPQVFINYELVQIIIGCIWTDNRLYTLKLNCGYSMYLKKTSSSALRSLLFLTPRQAKPVQIMIGLHPRWQYSY